jgi:hypothetical protein
MGYRRVSCITVRWRSEVNNKLPAHLRDDAQYKKCSVCGRKSWEDPFHEAICWVPQPNGTRCQGVLRLGSPASGGADGA